MNKNLHTYTDININKHNYKVFMGTSNEFQNNNNNNNKKKLRESQI